MSAVEYNHYLAIFIGAVLAPFFWWLLLSPILWFVRRFFPKWEKVLFQKME